MGFFSINTAKLPKDNELPAIRDQVWFPDLDRPGERPRILNQPGIKRLLDEAVEYADEAAVFEVNKTIKGPFGKVASSPRPGVVARTSETTFSVHLPMMKHPFDIGSMAVQEVQFDPVFVQAHEVEKGEHLGQLAIARAIRAQVMTPPSQ